MACNYNSFGGNLIGRTNAAAGTVYYAVIPGTPKTKGGFTRVVSFQLTSGATANHGYWMRAIGRANSTLAYTTSDSAIVLDADPSATGNTIAAGDQVVIEHSDGTYRRSQVNTSGWNSGTKTLTFTTTLPAAVAKGARVWNFGIFTDTDTTTGVVHPIVNTTANTTSTWNFQGGVRAHQPGEPILFYCPNATDATVLNYAEFANTVD